MEVERQQLKARRSLRILLLAAADVIHTRRWADYYRKRGHTVVLATLDPSGLEGSEEKVLNSFTGINAVRYPSAALSLRRLVKSFRPQVVNAHFVPGYGFLGALAPLARPLVVSVWGSDILLSPKKSFLHRLRARFTLSRAELVTCDGAVLVDSLKELGVKSSRILDVPMGIDPALFHPPSSLPPPAGPRTKSGRRPFLIVSQRRLEPLYDIATLLRSAAIIQEAGWNFECLVIGEGSRRADLEKLAGQLALADRVTFTGTLASGEIAEILRRADIYVSCSHSDSTSVSLLEAMATGLFPVVTDIPGNCQWIENGRSGLTFPPGDPGRLAENLVQAMQNESLTEKARAENLEAIRTRAIWEDNMKLVEERLLAVAGTAG